MPWREIIAPPKEEIAIDKVRRGKALDFSGCKSARELVRSTRLQSKQ
jgi:hypothetical protein